MVMEQLFVRTDDIFSALAKSLAKGRAATQTHTQPVLGHDPWCPSSLIGQADRRRSVRPCPVAFGLHIQGLQLKLTVTQSVPALADGNFSPFCPSV